MTQEWGEGFRDGPKTLLLSPALSSSRWRRGRKSMRPGTTVDTRPTLPFFRISDFGFRISFHQRHISTGNAFKMAVVGAQQQRAVVVERLGAAAELAFAGAN